MGGASTAGAPGQHSWRCESNKYKSEERREGGKKGSATLSVVASNRHVEFRAVWHVTAWNMHAVCDITNCTAKPTGPLLLLLLPSYLDLLHRRRQVVPSPLQCRHPHSGRVGRRVQRRHLCGRKRSSRTCRKHPDQCHSTHDHVMLWGCSHIVLLLDTPYTPTLAGAGAAHARG